jgi:hypothetical protein
MGLQDRIRAFIAGRAPQAVCDACVADHLSTAIAGFSAVAAAAARPGG